MIDFIGGRGVPSKLKIVILMLLFVAMVALIVLSFVKINETLPGYALREPYLKGYWVGFCLMLNFNLIYAVARYG